MSAEDDLRNVAKYFNDKYGSLEKALEVFDLDAEFDLNAFEVALKRWGVKAVDVADLFDHIDIDFSGRVSVRELFVALQQPMEDIQGFKAREELRRQQELANIYGELAKLMRRRFHSIEQFVEKKGRSQLSVTDFRKLTAEVGLELSSSQLQRIFSDVDNNGDGEISVVELKDKIGEYLVQDTLVEVAKALSERCTSIAEAFAELGLANPCATPMSMRSEHASEHGPHHDRRVEEMTEDKFVSLLRRLKLAEVLGETSSSLLYQALPTKSISCFEEAVQHVHNLQVTKAREVKLEFKKRVAELNKKEADQSRQAATRVDAWVQAVAKDPRGAASPAAAIEDWEHAARRGNAKSQLEDYLVSLDGYVDRHSTEVKTLRQEVERLREIAQPREPSEDRTPLSPKTPWSLPKAMSNMCLTTLEFPLPERPKGMKAEELLQAVATGKVSHVQELLSKRTDVNIAGWGGVTAVMAAVHHGRPAVLECLLQRRADLRRTDVRGRTALDHSLRRPEMRVVLRKFGAVTSKEMAKEAAVRAQRILELEQERMTLEAQLDKLRRFTPATVVAGGGYRSESSPRKAMEQRAVGFALAPDLPSVGSRQRIGCGLVAAPPTILPVAPRSPMRGA